MFGWEELEEEMGFMSMTNSMLPDEIIKNIFEYMPIHWMIPDTDVEKAFVHMNITENEAEKWKEFAQKD